MNVIVDGIATHYSIEGKGPVVLLLHGWGDDSSTFAQLTGKMRTGYQYVALDLPGFGKTESPKAAFDLTNYAGFVANFLKKINISEVEILIGHSNGGAIAIKAAACGLVKPKKLILLASSGVRSVDKTRKKSLRIAVKTLKIPAGLLPKSVQSKLKKKVYSAVGSDAFVAEHLQDTFRKVVSEDLQNESLKITAPTLLVYGDQDTATPLSYGKKFEGRIQGSLLATVSGAGHFLHQTHAGQVAKIVAEFIA